MHGDQLRTRDHVVAQSLGGSSGPTVWCCERCNVAKGAGDYAEFVAFANLILRRRRHLDARAAGAAFEAWLCAKVLS